MQGIIEAGEPWTDPDFPPAYYSLIKNDGKDRHTGDVSQFKNIEWKRVHEIFDFPRMFDNKMDPGDVS